MAVSLVGWQTRETRGESEPSWVGNRGFKILVVSGVLHGSMLSFFLYFFLQFVQTKMPARMQCVLLLLAQVNDQ